jgi:hypothetical protein
MKEYIYKYFGLGGHPRHAFRIKNTVKSVQIESIKLDGFDDKKYYNERDMVSSFIKELIDMDEWKNSWHVDYSSYHHDTKIRRRLKNILTKKIEDRKKEIEILEFGLKVLNKHTVEKVEP